MGDILFSSPPPKKKENSKCLFTYRPPLSIAASLTCMDYSFALVISLSVTRVCPSLVNKTKPLI